MNEDTNEQTALSTQDTPTYTIPDKFLVKGEDGAVDEKASYSKLSESYSHLEKRLGSGDARPASVDEYTYEADGFDMSEFKSIEGNQEFLNKAHELGLSNKQLEFVLGEYESRASLLLEGDNSNKLDSVVSTLKETFGNDYDLNMSSAYKAALASGFTQEDLQDPSIGNNIAFIKMASFFGKQISEGSPLSPSIANNSTGDDLEALMRDPDLYNPKSPNHHLIKAKISSMYAQGHSLKR